MSKIYVGDGNSFVWQWQPKEQIVLEGYPEGVFVHFANCDTVEAPVVRSRMEGDKLVADIPPELMQVDKDITVYVCDVDGTKHCHFLSVLSRPKPESYVTEPVEVLRYESLAERVAKLEKGGTGGAGSWAELKGKPVYMQGEQEKFDPAWLPDGGFGWTETGEATVEWDGSTEGLDVVAVGDDMALVRVSGLLPSAEAMIGRTVEMADGSSFEITAETAAQSGPVWVVCGPVGDDLLPVLYGVGVTEVDGITLPGTGLYAVLYPDQPCRFARVTAAYETVHRLDAKYLPEEAVREYTIDLDYNKTEVTSSDKNVLVGRIPNDLSAADINNAYASGQRLVVRLKIGDDGVAYMRLVGCGIRNWSFEVDMGSQYTADRIQKLYLELYQSEAGSDAMTARVAYVHTVLGGDTEQVQADWGQNDPEAPDYVKGRTHWEENNQTVIEWDGSTEGRDCFTCDGATYYKISNSVPTESDVIGGMQILTSPDGAVEEQISSEYIGTFVGCFSVLYAFVVHDTEGSIDGASYTAPSTGIYSVYADGSIYVSKFTYGSTVVHPLDEKWIPDSIARKTDIGQNLALDTTLTQSGKAADAKAVGDALDKLEAKIPEGGQLDPEQIAGAVSGWLDEHPEATTTVADKSITPGKTDFLVDRKPLEPEALTWETAGYNMIANAGYLDIRGVETVTVVHTGAAFRDVALALYTESQTQIQGFTVVSSTENQQIHYSDSGVSTNVTTLDIPALVGDTNAAFARIRVHQTTTNADSLFVYLGDPNAEPGFCWADKYGPPKLPDGAITLRHTDFFVTTGHNLIDTSRFEVTGYSGELYEQFGANIYVFGYIDVSERKNFYVRAYVGATGELSGIKIGCYDEDKNFINADGSLVTATKLRSYNDIVIENNQHVSGGFTLVYRYEVDDSVSFVRFAAKVANSSGIIAPAQLKYVVSSYEDILDMTSPPEQYWRGISDEWRDAIRAADATTPKTMVMIGDSLTNWGGGGDGTDGFLRIVHDKTGVVTTNEGQAGAWWQLMPGETADDISTNGVGRVNAIIRDGRKYDLYCFMLGTNAGANTDTGETSADPSTMPGAMRYCLEKLKAYAPTGQILVCLPPQRAEGNENQEKTNEVIAKIAAEYAVPTLDIYHRSGIVPNTKIPGIGYLQDGLHLAEPGCTVLGNLLAAEVKYLLCL